MSHCRARHADAFAQRLVQFDAGVPGARAAAEERLVRRVRTLGRLFEVRRNALAEDLWEKRVAGALRARAVVVDVPCRRQLVLREYAEAVDATTSAPATAASTINRFIPEPPLVGADRRACGLREDG